MQMTCTNTLAVFILELDRNDWDFIGRVVVGLVKSSAFNQGLFDARVLPMFGQPSEASRNNSNLFQAWSQARV